MRKKPFQIGQVTAKNLRILVMGSKFSPEATVEIERAWKLGAQVQVSPKALEALSGHKVTSFLNTATHQGVLDYPNCGLPTQVRDMLIAGTPEDVAKIRAAKITPVHIVFAEIDDNTGNYDSVESIDQVTGGLHHNTFDALNKAIVGGRVTTTTASGLKTALNAVEKAEELSQEVYDALYKMYTPSTLKAMSIWQENLAESVESFTEEGEAVLNDAGYLEEVTA